MSKDIRKEYNGRVLVKYCVKRGAKMRMGAGDHAIVKHNGSGQVIPLRPLGHGLQAKIVKWMVTVGLAVLSLIWIF